MKAKQFTIVVFVALIGGLIGGILSSQMFSGRLAFAKDDKPHKVIRAERFELVDKNGGQRALLGFNGKQTVFFMGSKGIDEYVFLINQEQGQVKLKLGKGIFFLREGIEITSSGIGSKIRFNDKSKGFNFRLIGGLDADGNPSIELYDKNRTNRLAIGTTELEYLATGSTEIRSEGSIVIFGKDGKVIRQMP